MQYKKINDLKNLGLKSQEMLNAVGIYTYEDLSKHGAIQVYLKVKQKGLKPSLNLLHALEGALRDIHWNKLPKEIRSELLLRLDAHQDLIDQQTSD